MEVVYFLFGFVDGVVVDYFVYDVIFYGFYCCELYLWGDDCYVVVDVVFGGGFGVKGEEGELFGGCSFWFGVGGVGGEDIGWGDGELY